jgi:hypothetical protein
MRVGPRRSNRTLTPRSESKGSWCCKKALCLDRQRCAEAVLVWEIAGVLVVLCCLAALGWIRLCALSVELKNAVPQRLLGSWHEADKPARGANVSGGANAKEARIDSELIFAACEFASCRRGDAMERPVSSSWPCSSLVEVGVSLQQRKPCTMQMHTMHMMHALDRPAERESSLSSAGRVGAYRARARFHP